MRVTRWSDGADRWTGKGRGGCGLAVSGSGCLAGLRGAVGVRDTRPSSGNRQHVTSGGAEHHVCDMAGARGRGACGLLGCWAVAASSGRVALQQLGSRIKRFLFLLDADGAIGGGNLTAAVVSGGGRLCGIGTGTQIVDTSGALPPADLIQVCCVVRVVRAALCPLPASLSPFSWNFGSEDVGLNAPTAPAHTQMHRTDSPTHDVDCNDQRRDAPSPRWFSWRGEIRQRQQQRQRNTARASAGACALQ